MGGSRYSLLSLVRLNVELITSFTTVPLALLGAVGAVTGVLGALAMAWCLWTATTSLAAVALAAVCLVTSAVYFATAWIGVYLARVYRTVAGGPSGYVIRSRSDRGDDQPAAGPHGPQDI